ncbi:hypothetical protein GALMADRAFT_141865 [Galerina marginata CBS 339.88]|uniref:Uncharacterized protein n=1 Tax=Galerina marginata (strain CBS 339.88) TaxID=685588 RepID=A0A067T2I0_GALM3|nr:hypothetical protein GALMADRAFT_141865 [Galerina marginata CBS 339.88]
MQNINYATSRQVNPSGATPKLTEAQVWKGLELKIRDPLNFAATTSSCHIVSDTPTKVVRKVGYHDLEPVEEVVKIYKGAVIYFDSHLDGHRSTNILSWDQNNEMVLTFSWVGGVLAGTVIGDFPGIEVAVSTCT